MRLIDTYSDKCNHMEAMTCLVSSRSTLKLIIFNVYDLENVKNWKKLLHHSNLSRTLYGYAISMSVPVYGEMIWELVCDLCDLRH